MKELEEMEASLAVEKARVASGLQAAKRQRRRELEARDQLLARQIAELQEEQQRNRAEREELASVPHSSQGSFVSHHEPPTPPAEHGRDLCAEGAGELKLEDVLALTAEENTVRSLVFVLRAVLKELYRSTRGVSTGARCQCPI